MGEVDDAHEPQDDVQAERDEDVEHPQGDAVDELVEQLWRREQSEEMDCDVLRVRWKDPPFAPQGAASMLRSAEAFETEPASRKL